MRTRSSLLIQGFRQWYQLTLVFRGIGPGSGRAWVIDIVGETDGCAKGGDGAVGMTAGIGTGVGVDSSFTSIGIDSSFFGGLCITGGGDGAISGGGGETDDSGERTRRGGERALGGDKKRPWASGGPSSSSSSSSSSIRAGDAGST